MDAPRYDTDGLVASNWLEEYFLNNKDLRIHKWWHYFEIYDYHFSRFRGKSPSILEIGVQNGGSAIMWKNYFGEGTKIVGLDIDPRCAKLNEEGIHVYIGSQEDRDLLGKIVSEHGPFDIVIDDGGHTMNQQIVSLDVLFPHVKDGGVYLCEDTHTSYWSGYGGGLNSSGTFTNYCKVLTDRVNRQYTNEIPDDYWSRWLWGVHFYDSIVVLDKRKRERSFHVVTGTRDL
jgi:SAM-dependent methyltransferase